MNVTVLKGVTIGDNCIIGAGSIVTKDIPSNSVSSGVPAKIVSSLDDYFEKRKKMCLLKHVSMQIAFVIFMVVNLCCLS